MTSRLGRGAPLRGFVIVETDEPLIATMRVVDQAILNAAGSYLEIAERLGVPPGTVRSRLHRARAALVALRQKQLAIDQ
jgi:hypothetical protein